MTNARQGLEHTVRTHRASGLGWSLAWGVLGLVSINFLASVYAKYHQVNPEAYAMFWTRQGWLWTHLGGGVLTIILGPIQFLTRWPKAFPRLHRWTGRIYMAGVFVGLMGATGLITTSPAPLEIRAAFASTALAWMATALTGLVAIYRGLVETHRRWMIRNYLVTLAPITFRFMLPAYVAAGFAPSPTAIAAMLALSWLLPLLGYEAARRALKLSFFTR